MRVRGPSERKVLLVEDDEGIRFGIADVLEEKGQVRAAESLAEALKAFEQERFAFVLADLRVGRHPDAGKKIVEAARRHLAPVAVMSGLLKDEIARVLGEASRPDAVVLKPFQLDALMDLIDGFFAMQERLDRAEDVPASGWKAVRPGVEQLERDEVAWIRLAPGARLATQDRGVALRMVSGDLRTGERRCVADESFFVGPAQQVEAGASGCVAVGTPPP